MRGLIGVALRAAILALIPETLPPQERVSRATALAVFGVGLALGGLVFFVAGRMFLLPLLAERYGGFQGMATSDGGRAAMFALMGLCALPVGIGFPVLQHALMIRAEAQGKGIPLGLMWLSSIGIMAVFIGGYLVWVFSQIPNH